MLAAIKENPLENVNIVWCFIVISILSEIPGIVENSIIGYLLLLGVFSFFLKEYFENRNIKVKYIFGKLDIGSIEIIGFITLIIIVQTIFRFASVYIFSYISPDKVLAYYSEPRFYVLTISTFLNGVIIVPVIEELFYRGILLNRLKGRNIKYRLILSSLVFGFVHLEWFIVTGIMGYILGYVYLKTNSLFVPIILHSAVNLTAFIARYFESETLQSIDIIRKESFYPSLIFFILLPLYIYLFRKFWVFIKDIVEVTYINNLSKEVKK